MGKYLDSTGLAYFWGKFKNRLLPSGGTAGQILAKSSATDYAVGWVNQSGGSSSGKTTLYDNATGLGTGQGGLLSQSAANYVYLDFIFTDGTRQYTQRLYDPNGKSFSLSRSVVSGTTIYHAAIMGSVSGLSISMGSEAQSVMSGNAISTASSTTLKLIKVLGGTDLVSANGQVF